MADNETCAQLQVHSIVLIKAGSQHRSKAPQYNKITIELSIKLSITSYTELQIVSYRHHPLWLPYHSYLPHTSLMKSQSFISTSKPTPLPPQLILSHLHPLLYYTISLQPPYSKSTTYSLNHLIHTVISILFLPPY